MQIAYIGVYIVGGETAMACWDWLGSGGIDPTTPGLPRSLPRGVDRAPGPLDLLPGDCRPWRAPARPPQVRSSSHKLAPVGDGGW